MEDLDRRGPTAFQQIALHTAIQQALADSKIQQSKCLIRTVYFGYFSPMRRQRIYVETTIPSLYHDERSSPAVAEMRWWTRKWWAEATKTHELVTGAAVLYELRVGPPTEHTRWLSLIAHLEVLEMVPRVIDIAETYRLHKLMPSGPSFDAVHLALASYYNCEVLVTWDRRHLANANKVQHIARINSRLGLSVPRLQTPLELFGGSHGI
ncbi:MAG TPA: PIN domain-containing protein [Longimicrobium sp.]|nr:PIN domain-containing protein [Longimicrobium sp.]